MTKATIWMPVLNSERYLISNYGDLVDTENWVYKPFTVPNSRYVNEVYPSHTVGKDRRLVHHLVFEAFKQEIPKQCELVVDHVDENKSNPFVGNLQLITKSQNTSKNWKMRSRK